MSACRLILFFFFFFLGYLYKTVLVFWLANRVVASDKYIFLRKKRLSLINSVLDESVINLEILSQQYLLVSVEKVRRCYIKLLSMSLFSTKSNLIGIVSLFFLFNSYRFSAEDVSFKSFLSLECLDFFSFFNRLLFIFSSTNNKLFSPVFNFSKVFFASISKLSLLSFISWFSFYSRYR